MTIHDHVVDMDGSFLKVSLSAIKSERIYHHE